ncbi:hypothetical protein, partial [Klebsiella pneumoniae]|uniref:hypothetical protein n=1 Tax=Klebsiella pneumoniae TaxID=573 RepID=UPI00351CD1B7
LRFADDSRHKVHLRLADNAGEEFVDRFVVLRNRRTNFFDFEVVLELDFIGVSHRLQLIVRDIQFSCVVLLVLSVNM